MLPGIVRVIAEITHTQPEISFVALAALSFWGFLFTLYVLLGQRVRLQAVTISSIVILPALFSLFETYFLPDMFHAFLLAVLIYLLVYQRLSGILATLFMLILTRESSLLVGSWLIFLNSVQKYYRRVLALILVIAVAWACTSSFSSFGQPNIHGLPTLVYTAIKIPFNASKNVFGVILWTNTFSDSEITNASYQDEPLWKLELPESLQIGSITSLGIYGFDFRFPLITVLLWLTTFGVMPTILLFAWRRRRTSLRQSMDIVLGFALTYGLSNFLLAPFLGASVQRLMIYGWPAFWVAAPVILFGQFSPKWQDSLRILGVNLAVAWLPVVFITATFVNLGLLILIAASLHRFTWKLMSKLPFASAVSSL
jgi:hypothetical protein